MRRALRRAVWLSACVAGGCSLAVDTEGYQDGLPSHGALPASAPVDGSVITDAGTPPEAAPDADASADAGSYCERLPQHDFCQEFTTSITDGWGEPVMNDPEGSQLLFVPNDGVTAPGAFQATSKIYSSERGGNYIRGTLKAPGATHVKLHFAVKPIARPDLYDVILVRFTYGNMLVYLEASQDAFTMRNWFYGFCTPDTICKSQEKASAPLAKGQWADITVTIEPAGGDAGTSRATLQVNSKTVDYELAPEFNRASGYFYGEYQLWMGYIDLHAATNNAWDTMFDDVSIDAHD